MPDALKAPLWAKLMLALPLLFIIWSLSLIVSVNGLQRDVTGKVVLVGGLNGLELSLHALEKEVRASQRSGARQPSHARWKALVADYRRNAALVFAHEYPLIAPPLAELDTTLAKMDQIYNQELSPAVSDTERAISENEFRAALINSLDGVESAIREIRRSLSQHSTELAAKWRQLNLLVVISCLLAVVVAFLFNRISRDLARRKQAQGELKRERDFSRAVIETVASLVVVLDREGRIIRFNRACEQLTGYEFSEVEGRFFWDLFIAPEESQMVRANFAKLQAGEFPIENENHWLTKDGGRRLISWANTSLLDAVGKPEYIIGTGLDITEPRHAEAALRKSHNVLRAVIEGTPDAIFVKDLEGRYIMVNTAFARFLGEPIQEIIGKSDTELYLPETAQQFIEDDRQVLSTGETRSFEGVAHGPSITQMYLVTKAVYRDHQGKVIGLIGISHDITERKRAEEQRLAFVREQQARMDAEEANRIKDEFLTTLSHELRTPLTSILGWTQLLNTEQLDTRNRERALEVIGRNARAQRQLIDDLLDISRIVTGKIRLDTRPTTLAPLIEAAMDGVRPTAALKNIQLELSLDAVSAKVEGDAGRLQQVFWNLLTNALKFTPEGGCVGVRLESFDDAARITVADTGEGISAEFLPYVFDRFRQGDSSTTREYGGLGLGLALVQYLVELHGGTVRVESPGEGEGSTFTVNLPLLPAQEEAQATIERPSPLKAAASNGVEKLEGLRVLVVDDDEDACEIVGLALEKCGAKTRLANTASVALEVLESWRPDLLISDIGMPEHDGYALLQKVRNLPPERGGLVPALALTAYATETDRERVLAAGFQLHVVKPVELKELAEAVASLVGRAKEV